MSAKYGNPKRQKKKDLRFFVMEGGYDKFYKKLRGVEKSLDSMDWEKLREK